LRRAIPVLFLLAGCSSYEPEPLNERKLLEDLRSIRLDLPADGLLPDQAVALALVHNPELGVWRRAHEIAEKVVVSEGAWSNPQFRPSVENLISSGGNPLSLAMGLRIFPGPPGESAARLARAEAKERKTLAQIEDQETKVAARVRIAHAKAVMLEEKLRIVEASQRLQAHVSEAIDRRLIGFAATRLDETLVLLRSEELRNERGALESQREGALAELGLLLGASPGAPIRVRRPAQDPAPPPARSQQELEDEALKERADLRALKEEYEAKEQSLRLAHLAHVLWPRFLEPGVEKLPRGYSLELGAAFEIPIFNSGSADIAVAEAERRMARESFAAKLQAVRGEILEARMELREAERRRRHYADRLEPALKQAEEVVKAALEAGEADTLKLVSIEMRVLDARRDAAQARFDLERRKVGLALAAGTILR
jgi:outer membrane protein, heavy metal efflux system